MRKLFFFSLIIVLVSCGNSTRQNNDLSDTAMVLEDSFDVSGTDTATVTDTVKTEETKPKATKDIPAYVPEPRSDEYDEGYHKGYADGEEDGYTHSGYQSTYDDSNDYHGSAADDYEKGYSCGYEDGYDDNVEYEDE